MPSHEPVATLPDPAVEAVRLDASHGLQTMDGMAPEEAFDDLVWLASRLCDAPIALVALVEDERPRFAARRGLESERTAHALAFVAHAIAQDGFFEVPDARVDPRLAGDPLVTGAPGLRSYAGVPLAGADGLRFGTLCVLDTRARRLDANQREALWRLARRAGDALETRRQRATAQMQLARMHEERALTDALTGLPNRAAWAVELERGVARAHRAGMAAAVMFVDLEGFKQINDRYGHDTGDAVLVEFAARLRRALRRSDFIARLAGDEFVVLLDRVTDAAGNPPVVAVKLIAAMQAPVEANGHVLQVTPNIGVAVRNGPDFDAATLMRQADEAMYAIKRARPGVSLAEH
jgi:diguanylate cyclase (GGDEF)-like protein